MPDKISRWGLLSTARINERMIPAMRAAERSELLAEFRQDAGAARALLDVGKSPPDATLDTTEHAAWTTIARMILNLDEAITK